MAQKIKDEFDILDCDAGMKSKAKPGHTHTCIGNHNHGEDHYCGECMMWWGRAWS